MSLAALQADFALWLRGDADEAPPRVGAAATPGLGVYRNNYRAQLVACLETSFPCTHAWIGDNAFHAAVVTHVTRVPPSSWTLDAYPRDFPMTLATLYPEDRDVAELAWLELALGEAFVAEDAEPLSAAEIGEVDWDRAVLRFTPSLDIRSIETNVAALWSALADEVEPPPAQRLPRPAGLIVWRCEGRSCFRQLEALEYDILLGACAGRSFGDLCVMLVADRGEAEGVALAGAYLGQWLRDGLLAEIVDERE